MTTLAYQKMAASTNQGHVRLNRNTLQRLLAHRRASAGRQTESEPWPRISGRGIGIRSKPRASYVLHREPDGSWFIDQLKPDTASELRPIAANTQEHADASAPAANHAELCFIIEIS